MRVLFVVDDFPLNKNDPSVIFVAEEARQLVRKGIEVAIVTRKNKNKTEKSRVEFDGLHVYIFDQSNERLNLRWLKFLRVVRLLKPLISNPYSLMQHLSWAAFTVKAAQEIKADLIHGHFAYPGGYVAALASKVLNRPLVVTLRGVDVQMEPTINYGLRFNPKTEKLVKLTINLADGIITVSRQVAEEAVKLIKEDRKKNIFIVNNAVDTSRFTPNINKETAIRITGLPYDRPIIFSLGRYHAKKGYDRLIIAAAQVVEKHPKALFVIAGKDKGEKTKLQALVYKLGLKENLRLLDVIPPSLVPYYYAVSKIYVLPSLIEGFPNTILEAMASAKPVIATKVGGVVDLIKDGYNGFLVDQANPYQLAEKISLLLEDEELAKRLGEAARKTIEANFSIERKIKEIISVYQHVMNT